jgi:membrane fusion protein
MFRKEAVAQREQRFHGSILLVRPVRFTVYTTLFTLICLSIATFVFFGDFQRSENVPGVILPSNGLVRIFTPQTGILIEQNAVDGQIVHEGDLLFVLTAERFSGSKSGTQALVGEALAKKVERLKDELVQQQAQFENIKLALHRRWNDINAQLVQIDADIGNQNKRLALSRAAEARFQELEKSHYISPAQLQERAADVLDQESKLHALERSRVSLRMDLSNTETDFANQPLKARREALALERAIVEINQNQIENNALQRIEIRAPRSGVITPMAGEIGQIVDGSKQLAYLTPADGKVSAELYAPSSAIGFVKNGTHVQLRVQAFPYQKFGHVSGYVQAISQTAVQPSEIALPFAKSASSEPFYRIRVLLDSGSVQAYGRQQMLRSGMQVEASLLLETRKLYEWIIEPLYSVKGKL